MKNKLVYAHFLVISHERNKRYETPSPCPIIFYPIMSLQACKIQYRNVDAFVGTLFLYEKKKTISHIIRDFQKTRCIYF